MGVSWIIRPIRVLPQRHTRQKKGSIRNDPVGNNLAVLLNKILHKTNRRITSYSIKNIQLPNLTSKERQQLLKIHIKPPIP